MQKLDEDKIYEMTEKFFNGQKKTVAVECLSTLLSKLLSDGVAIGEWDLEPSYIEYSDDNGLIQREYAKYNKSPIRDTLRLNFTEHDKKVTDKFRKEFIKNTSMPKEFLIVTKQEYMDNYTMEQLVDRIVLLDEFFKESNFFNSLMDKTEFPLEKSIKDNYEAQIRQKEAKISSLEKEREELRNQRNEQMTIVNELKQKIKTLEEQSEQDGNKTILDFLPEEPIKVADTLINAELEYERSNIEKAFCGNDKGKCNLYDTPELRQIAEHLLVYCNANGEKINYVRE